MRSRCTSSRARLAMARLGFLLAAVVQASYHSWERSEQCCCAFVTQRLQLLCVCVDRRERLLRVLPLRCMPCIFFSNQQALAGPAGLAGRKRSWLHRCPFISPQSWLLLWQKMQRSHVGYTQSAADRNEYRAAHRSAPLPAVEALRI